MLGEARYQKAVEAGALLDRDSAVALATRVKVERPAKAGSSGVTDPLGKREREVASSSPRA